MHDLEKFFDDAPASLKAADLSGGTAWALPTIGWQSTGPIKDIDVQIRRHILRMSTVRTRVRHLDRLITFSELRSTSNAHVAAWQDPYETGETWAAATGIPKGGRTTITAYIPLEPPAGQLVGFLVDEWTDVVPSENVTTTIAFHYDAPSAAAPNSALLCVPTPDSDQWTFNSVIDHIDGAMSIAKLRAVDPELLTGAGPLIPPLYSRESPARGAVPAFGATRHTKTRRQR